MAAGPWSLYGGLFLHVTKFGEVSFQEYASEGILYPVFYFDLVYKIRRVKSAANYVSSGSKQIIT